MKPRARVVVREWQPTLVHNPVDLGSYPRINGDTLLSYPRINGDRKGVVLRINCDGIPLFSLYWRGFPAPSCSYPVVKSPVVRPRLPVDSRYAPSHSTACPIKALIKRLKTKTRELPK
jgi:hypothetical protein